jgi:N-acetyl-alpha-D-muramate 1-phosphate uridylyltransferase
MKGHPQIAMVLAAGLGTRMGALGAARPKPLVEVAGRSLIERVLDHVAAARIPKVVINVHHMASMLEQHLAARSGGPEIIFSDERGTLLDTGGGIKKALGLLGDDPFIVLNADCLWTDDSQNTLESLWQTFDPGECDILLDLVTRQKASGFEGTGDYRMDPSGNLTRQLDGRSAPYIFTGIRVIAPSVFAGVEADRFSLLEIFDAAEAAGRLKGHHHNGRWFHVGTPQALVETEKLLAQAAKLSQKKGGLAGVKDE